MFSMKVKGISIVILMLLFGISTTCGQDQNNTTTEQQQSDLTGTISNLEQMRLILLQKLVAIIPVKQSFASKKASASSECNQNDLPNTCTYTFKSGQTLTEAKDLGGYLLTDSFQDKTTNMQLDTEYTIYNRPQCYTLIDNLLQVSLQVCYPCANNTTSILWLNQTVTNITTGDSLTWTANCCGNITSRTYSKVPGRPFTPVTAPAVAPATTPLTATGTTPTGTTPTPTGACTVTGQAEIISPI
jgi:hypothetical protein